MNPRSTTEETWQTELASRESNGITVRLLWNRSSNVASVAVADAANDDFFVLVLDEHDRAMDVFHHPYAHAAARGLEFGSKQLEPEVLRDAA